MFLSCCQGNVKVRTGLQQHPQYPGGTCIMEWKLEVVVVPVADIDRAKHFYADQLGFKVELEMTMDEQYHIVQLTPPGSGCSINLDTGFVKMQPGSVKGLQLVVSDVEAAR